MLKRSNKQKSSFFKPFLLQLEDRITPTAFSEPIVLASTNGVLDITLLGHQSNQLLETSTGPSTTALTNTGGFYTYQWTLNAGQAKQNGVNVAATTGDSYPGPTLFANRGDTIRITLQNDLPDSIPLAPNVNTAFKLASTMAPGPQPINNHMHGLHVSPGGASDNVLLEIPQSMAFVYEYVIPQSQPDGLFWIHNHRHEFTSDQTYRGLASMLIIGNAASNINQISAIPAANQRVMALQTQTLAHTTNPSIPTYLTTPMANGSAITVAGLPNPTQYLQYFQGGSVQTPELGTTGGVPTAFLKQYSVNGLVNPTITVGQNQTEVWSFANISAVTNFQIQLYDQSSALVSGKLFQIAQDGNALVNPVAGNGLIIAPGSRYSFAITAPSISGNTYTIKANDIQSGTSNANPPYNISLVTLIANSSPGSPTNITTSTILTSSSNLPFEDLSTQTVTTTRTVTFSSEVANPNAGGSIAGGTGNAFEITGESFPNNLIFQPRLNTVEEWTLYNYSNQPHPFHIHVNDFQVMSIFAPTEPSGAVQFYPGNVTTPYQYGLDVINVPPALFANKVITGLTVTSGASGHRIY